MSCDEFANGEDKKNENKLLYIDLLI